MCSTEAAKSKPLGGETTKSGRPQSLRVLSLDGGGMKGYTSLLILQRIFRQLVPPGQQPPKPCDVFDLIAGTSTGGLIATMLGRLELSIDECLFYYERMGKDVFGKSPSGGSVGKLFRGVTSSAFYDIKKLQTCVKEVLAEKEIPIDTPFRGGNPNLSKVMLCITRTGSQKADVIRNYWAQAASEEDYDCQIWEAASATAAAPMFFEPVRLSKNGERFCDGGLQRNNPINEVLAEVSKHNELKTRAIGCVLSIGTGASKISEVPPNLFDFLRESIKMMTNSEHIADEFERSPKGMELFKSERYFRFSVPQGLEDLKMDEWRKCDKMNDMTCASLLLEPDKNPDVPSEGIITFLPARQCPHFVQRPEYTGRISDFFQSKKSPMRYVLWGMGGIGKTQIALDYALTRSKRSSVFWVRSDQLSSFSNDYREVLQALRPELSSSSELTTDEKMLKAACQALDEHHDALLVLDNADDLSLFFRKSLDGVDLSTFLPPTAHILLSTRDPAFQGSFALAHHGTQILPMTPSEADQLLLSSVPPHLAEIADQCIVNNLLNELAGLPLAIAQAATNMREMQMGLTQ